MRYIDEAREPDFEGALRLIHERASSYQGPRIREFLEIARRSAPEDSESEPQVWDVTERQSPKERFSEVLALLLTLAFPPDRDDEKAVRHELAQVLHRRVHALHIRDGERIIKVADQLRRYTPKAERELEQMLRRFLQRQDELHEDRRG